MEYNSTEKIDNALQEITAVSSNNLKSKLDQILNKLPSAYKSLIDEAFIYKRIPKEFLFSSILFAVSASTGLTFYIKALGYKNFANCYFAILGSRGDTKSEAIKIALAPIKKSDDTSYDNYIKSINEVGDDTQVIRKQTLIQNATIEAAQKVHSQNPNGVGLYMDELFSLIDKMSNSKSRDGVAWRNFFLEGYNNGHIDVARKTTESFRMKETYPTLIGGLQSQFTSKLFAHGNLESGFIDRLFFTNLISSNNVLTKGAIHEKTILEYERLILNILSYKRQGEKQEDLGKQFEIKLSGEAHENIFQYSQRLILEKQKAPAVIKEYHAKMLISIHKLCIIVFMVKNAVNSEFASLLTKEDVDLAIQINEFYFENFKLNVKDFSSSNKLEVDIQALIELAKSNNSSQKAVAEVTGLNKATISKRWNKLSA